MSLTLLDECASGNIEGVKRKILNEAYIKKADNDGYTPLCYASSNGHLEIVKVLTASGALLDKADNDGETPLCYASNRGQEIKITSFLKMLQRS